MWNKALLCNVTASDFYSHKIVYPAKICENDGDDDDGQNEKEKQKENFKIYGIFNLINTSLSNTLANDFFLGISVCF